MFAAVVSQVDSDGPPPGDGRETDETGTNPNEGDETSGSFGCHSARISERIRYGLKKEENWVRLRIELSREFIELIIGWQIKKKFF